MDKAEENAKRSLIKFRTMYEDFIRNKPLKMRDIEEWMENEFKSMYRAGQVDSTRKETPDPPVAA